MQHDVRLRATARVIYDACYPAGECTALGFDEAERHRTIHYQRSVDAALQARTSLATRPADQLALI